MHKKHELQQQSWLKELYKGSGNGRRSDYAPLVVDSVPAKPVERKTEPPPEENWEKLSREERLQMAAKIVAEMEIITGKYKRPEPTESDATAPFNQSPAENPIGFLT